MSSYMGIFFGLMFLPIVAYIMSHYCDCQWIREDTEDLRKVKDIVFSEEDPMEMHDQLIRLFDKRDGVK